MDWNDGIIFAMLEYGESHETDERHWGIALELKNVPKEFGAKVGIETCIRG